jgi:hypothetical protein
MSLDQRLREELRQEAAAIEPDIEHHLGAVEAGARRQNGIGTSWMFVAAAMVVVAIILRFPNGQNNGPAGPQPSVAPSLGVSASPSAPASYPQIAGTYTATLDPTDATLVTDGVAGTWTIRLEPTGALLVSIPSEFLADSSSMSGTIFSLTGDRFRTNLFYTDPIEVWANKWGQAHCDTVGNYVWNLTGGRLSFTSIDDTCPMRKTLLTTTPWLTSR